MDNRERLIKLTKLDNEISSLKKSLIELSNSTQYSFCFKLSGGSIWSFQNMHFSEEATLQFISTIRLDLENRIKKLEEEFNKL